MDLQIFKDCDKITEDMQLGFFEVELNYRVTPNIKKEERLTVLTKLWFEYGNNKISHELARELLLDQFMFNENIREVYKTLSTAQLSIEFWKKY